MLLCMQMGENFKQPDSYVLFHQQRKGDNEQREICLSKEKLLRRPIPLWRRWICCNIIHANQRDGSRAKKFLPMALITWTCRWFQMVKRRNRMLGLNSCGISSNKVHTRCVSVNIGEVFFFPYN